MNGTEGAQPRSTVPPRTSSLSTSVAPPQSILSPPPEQRVTRPQDRSNPNIVDQNTEQWQTEQEGEEEIPPSYEETRQAEPNNPRFGRWRNWVEKRGVDRRLEREEMSRNGQSEKTSWDLPRSNDSALDATTGRRWSWDRGQDQESDQEAVRIARTRDELMENRLSSAGQYSISNPDYLQPQAGNSRESRSRSSSAASTGTGGGGGTRNRLTKNVTIERLGSRFDRGLPQKPLCGMMLPTQAPSSNLKPEEDRFLLVGTSGGLYIVDLEPALSSSAPLRTSSPSSTSSPADSSTSSTRIVPLWLGIGVYHLECYVEPAKPKSEGAKGLLVMLVGNEAGGLEVKMWSLSAIVNLVKWRIYNEVSKLLYARQFSFLELTILEISQSSNPLDLTPIPAHHNSNSHARNASFSSFKKSILNSPSPKGKGKQLSPDSASFPKPAHKKSDSNSTISSPPPLLDDRTALPHEWYNSSVRLPLPKPHTPILFFSLSRMPLRSEEDTGSVDSEDDSDVEDLTNEQLRKRSKLREEEGKLFLLVATKGVVYVFESSLEQRRSWKLTRELTAPSTPRFMQLVRSPKISTNVIHATSHAPRSASTSSSSSTTTTNEAASYPLDLCLLLGLSHRSVLIHLSDCSVVELVIPSSSSTSSTSSTPLSRSRTKSVSNSIKSTASSSTTTHHHKFTPSLKLNLMDNPIVKKVQQVIEGGAGGGKQSGVPAGFTGGEKITLGRKLNENGDSTEDLRRSLSVTSSRDEESRWIGSEELVVQIGKGKRNLKRFELLTKGFTTQLFNTPLQDKTSSQQFETHSHHSSPVVSLNPIHTFKWSTDLEIRKVTHSITTISDTVGRTGKGKSHLVLIAFTLTGLSIQEGYISQESILNPSSSLPVFTPTPTTSTLDLSRLSVDNSRIFAGREEEDEDEDLSNSATLDFATDSAQLCSSLKANQVIGGSQGHSSIYLYTRSHADYVVKRISFT
ncbi:hypothetical protein JCM3765_003283 [Sporobolomyces pararoseus]